MKKTANIVPEGQEFVVILEENGSTVARKPAKTLVEAAEAANAWVEENAGLINE